MNPSGNGIHSNGLVASTSQSHSPPSEEEQTAHVNGVTHNSGPSVFDSHNEEVVNHLYRAFQTGNYSDIALHVHHTIYRLHSIVLSRSPLLAHLMSTTPYPPNGTQHTIYLNLAQEPDITQEGLHIALGYLYSSIALEQLRPDNARGVLGAACLLGGMEELCQYAYDICRGSLGVDNISEWLEFLDRVPPTTDANMHPNVFGGYSDRLRDDIFDCLVAKLPQVLGVCPPTGGKEGRKTLLQIFSRVPFDLFKSAMESPAFQIGPDEQRFKFAKEAIEARRSIVGKGAEENVVLAFGGANAMGGAVHITRKVKKRALWKVSNQASA